MNNKAIEIETRQGQRKKDYEPPRLMTISLRPEEAVLGHCKISAASGPATSTCAALNCMTIGS